MLRTRMRRFGLCLFVDRGDEALSEGLIHAPLRALIKIRPSYVLSRRVFDQKGELPIVMRAFINEAKHALVSIHMPLERVLRQRKLR